MAFFHLNHFFYLIALVVPLSIPFENSAIQLGLSVPAEPLIIVATIVFMLKKIMNGGIDKSIYTHPVTLVILFNIAWIAITAIVSEMPLVSFKFLLARIWFVVVFYFLALEIFSNLAAIKKYMWIGISTILIVIAYTLVSHAQFGFGERSANAIMYPFYNDHTAYAAVLVMYLPFLAYAFYTKTYNRTLNILALGLLLIFIIAIVFSYTRAAWVSLAAAMVILLFLKLKIKFRTLILLALVGIGYLLFNSSDILMKLSKNKQDASENFTEHIQSISNISSDASNVERINRWKCAIKMFLERPVFGWGPGTYSFKYAPFQEAKDRTIISTNFGTGGNAHSEYLGPLAESGVLGAASILILVFFIFSLGFRIYYASQDKEIRTMVLILFFALITYLVHGVLNNFLDTDKASAPFWGFLAALVAIDIRQNKKDELLKSTAK